MVCFEVADYAAACRLFDRLTVIQRGQLGGVEPHQPAGAHVAYGLTDEQLKAAGVTRGMVRLSVGLEHVDDLIATRIRLLPTNN
jgi:O-acetylhomoserine (thiol)-lyase